jgi:hypothetical protein
MTGGRAPKQAGDRFERDVVAYLRDHGHVYAERCYGAGRPDDRGDIDGLPGWVIQVKAERRLDIGTALTAAEAQRRDRLQYAAAICKRRNHPTGDAYVVVSLETFAAIAGDTRQEGQTG